MGNILIIGAGISGCVAARQLAEHGNNVTIIDKRNHIAGNCYDYFDKNGIVVHKYGPHLFHTNNEKVFNYLSRFTDWIPYTHKVKALYNNQYLTLPVNKETKEIVGEENVLDIFFRPYTKKMWGMELEEINPKIINRVPIRDDMNEKYFPNDKFQCLPKNGYTFMCQEIIHHKNIKLNLNTEFNRSMINNYDHVFSCMPIDLFYNSIFGELPYRSIKFKNEYIIGKKSEHVTVNFTDDDIYTRWTEWSNLPYKNDSESSVITYEIPCDYKDNKNERYYPVNDMEGINKELYNKYKELSKKDNKVTHLGRLGLYAYLDMHQAVNSTLITINDYVSKT